MKFKQKYKGLLYIFLTLFLLIVAVISGRGILSASAEVYDNSDALKDLKRDRSFDENNYPSNDSDYSIYVIQIGESSKGNLYVYTYQPCQRSQYLIATDINMALSETVEGTKLYELFLVNTNGVFGKYLVKDVKVSEAETRYYNITSIYRAWDKELDKDTGNNNVTDKVAFTVRNIYKVTTENGKLNYSCEPTYVVNIINPYSDYLTYCKQLSINPPNKVPSISFDVRGQDSFDSHYIAFSTDWEIDRLKSATVSYSHCSGNTSGSKFLFIALGMETTYDAEQTGYAYPTYKDKVAVPNTSFWHGGRKNQYNWDRIQTVSEFLASEQYLNEETKQNLAGKQWILRFLETDRTYDELDILGYASGSVKFTKVSSVAVLRLDFETDGVTYNLGAVSDMVSGDDKPGNVAPKPDEDKSFLERFIEFFENLWNKIKGITWQQWLLIGLAIIVVIALIITIIKFGIKAVLNFILWLFKKLFQGLWWLICLPFRAIYEAVKESKAKKNNKSERGNTKDGSNNGREKTNEKDHTK